MDTNSLDSYDPAQEAEINNSEHPEGNTAGQNQSMTDRADDNDALLDNS